MTEIHYLNDMLVLLAAAVIVIPLFQRLGLGAVLGYLVAGIIVGPWGLGFIDRIEEIRHIAEFGVIFLLFIIGVELKPARLWAMKRMVFGLGTAQVMLTGIVIAGLALFLGQPLQIAVIIGFGLALSSTAFGLQILNERGEMGSRHGQTAFSVLLLQDLAVVPLLTLVSLLAADTALLEGIELAILEAILVIVLVVLIGRFLLSPVLHLVATSRTAEVFTAAAIFAVLGTAWLMEQVGLSLALGAFLAGLLMANSQYRHQVIADIQPFRGILLGLFFMGVGMNIDFGLLGSQFGLIAALVVGLLLLKSVILWILCRLMRVGAQDAMRVSVLLSQSGEFGFVLFGLAAISGVLSEDLFHLLTLLIALTMAATPLMANLCDFIGKCLVEESVTHDVSTNHIENGRPHVILAGFGRMGRRIARILQAGNVPYVAIDNNADRVNEGRQDGYSVFYGDATRIDVLKAAGAEQISVMVCALDQAIVTMRMVNIMRHHFPDAAIYVRGRDQQHCEQLLQEGASVAISETLEASLQLGAAVLGAMGVVEDDAATVIELFRREYYR